MERGKKIDVDELKKTSETLIDKITVTLDFYSILLLSYMTLYQYTKGKKNHVNVQTRIDLAETFFPDLCQHLKYKKIIAKHTYSNVMVKYKLMDTKEVQSILRSYLFANRTQIRKNKKEKSSCVII